MANRGKCVNAGMMLERWIKAYGQDQPETEAVPVFPENVRGYVPLDDLVVPHSGLALHVGAAGKPVVAWACRRNGRSCAVVWGDEDGGCGFVDGVPSEVLRPGVLRGMQRVFGYPSSFKGLGRRSRRGRR